MAKTEVFKVGDEVMNKTSKFKFKCIVRARFKISTGGERYIVEDNNGVLHIWITTNVVKYQK